MGRAAMKQGTYCVHNHLTVVARQWDGGDDPDVRQHGEGLAFVMTPTGAALPIQAGDWIVRTADYVSVWPPAEFATYCTPVLETSVHGK